MRDAQCTQIARAVKRADLAARPVLYLAVSGHYHSGPREPNVGAMEIFKSFAFEAAHRLPRVPADHKCARLHGHSFQVTVHVAGAVGADSGWVMDFGELKDRCKPVIEALDHRYLNDIEGLDNPTSENIARWLWQRLVAGLPQLSKIVVRETCTSGCAYTGD